VHSGYARTVTNGPAGGRSVLIRLSARRFFCGNDACPKGAFAEQVPGLTGHYLRRSLQLLSLLAQIGLVLAGGKINTIPHLTNSIPPHHK
jgi:hypothetical protein